MKFEIDARLVRSAQDGGPESFAYRTLASTLRDIAVGHFITRNKQHKLFADLRRMGLNLPAPPSGWPEEARSVIHVSVVKALGRFMQKQVMEGGWDPSRGASLNTYFINACKYSFAHEYRRYLKSEATRETPTGDISESLDQHRAPRVPDPEETAVHRDMIARALPPTIDARLRYMFHATAEGKSQAEIAEYLGMTAEAVSSMMRRHRRQIRAQFSDDGGR
jgi:RNA polymerase sigma factor (sigma-70 family)